MRATVERETLHRWASPLALAPTDDFDRHRRSEGLFRRHLLLGAPLAEQRPQRRRFHRLVEHRDFLLPRGEANIRTAVGGDQDRRNALAEAMANIPDGGDAVAAVEVVVDQ